MTKIKYELTRGSDIIRDGMFLELSEAGTSPLKQIAEIVSRPLLVPHTF